MSEVGILKNERSNADDQLCPFSWSMLDLNDTDQATKVPAKLDLTQIQ